MTQIDAELKPGRKLGFISTWLLAQLVFLVIAFLSFRLIAISDTRSLSYDALLFAALIVFPPTSFMALWGIKAALGGRGAKIVFIGLSGSAIWGIVFFSDLPAVYLPSICWLIAAIPVFLVTAFIRWIRDIEAAFAERRAARREQRRLERLAPDTEEIDEYLWLHQHPKNANEMVFLELDRLSEYRKQQAIHAADPTSLPPTF